ncbi:MAG TPA: hypothetical protein VGU22_13130 [Methylomirabilota bacterium]|jgi:hypothetical protein|nr:hypothetical protein [Methylomirabilota bacterium]
MKQYLKGNYALDVVIEEPDETPDDSTDAFERKALARLGGSICFVSKKGFLWKGEGADGSRPADRTPA